MHRRLTALTARFTLHALESLFLYRDSADGHWGRNLCPTRLVRLLVYQLMVHRVLPSYARQVLIYLLTFYPFSWS